MDRGLSLRTTFWLAGSAFLVSACWCFAAYLRFGWPWWVLACALGGLVGLVVLGLEWLVASPLDALVRQSAQWAAGQGAGAGPASAFAARELRELWRSGRATLEQVAQADHAQRANGERARVAEARARLLGFAVSALADDGALEAVGPGLLGELARTLDVPAVYLVPLRSEVRCPALGPEGPSPDAGALRQTGLAPWATLFEQGGHPVGLCLTEQAPAWREAWGGRTLWSVPLVHRGVAQGLLLAPLEGADRTWTPDELALLAPLSALLAANLAATARSEKAPAASGGGKRGRSRRGA